FMQLVLPLSLYPAILGCQSDGSNSNVSSCLNSTLGHPSAFGSFMFLFVGLTIWKMGQSRQWLWGILIAIQVLFVVMSKSFSSLIMVMVFIMALIAPKLNFAKLIGGVLFLAIVLSLFASTDFGQQKIAGLLATPVFNPDIDITRTILLSFSDGNSANWRLAHWYFLLQSWQQSPILGYGLATSSYLSLFAGFYAHNDYVRFLAEEGLVGFILFLTFIGVQISRLVRLMRNASTSTQKNLCSTMIAILIGILTGMASDNIWSHTTLFLYWSVLSAVVSWNWDTTYLYSQE
ncbi:MAG: O-antigen ligase family protein, partial [Nostocaceae cyanobacterium]|nr:O-antigen ligase family protein [Nostocaceae cyanobacterium]